MIGGRKGATGRREKGGKRGTGRREKGVVLKVHIIFAFKI